MNLTLDIGNTRAKLILFDGDRPVHEEILSGDLKEALKNVAERFHPENCAWCNVSGNDEEIAQALQVLPCPKVHLTGMSAVPLNVCYQTRNTLGADRLAAVLGATALCPKTPLLVIDAGTCITYDLVDAQGNYLGGNISPGLEMRFKALEHYTARLPKVEAEGDLPEVGINTETAIRCGVVRGLLYEIEGYAAHLQQKHPHLQVFLTGGSNFNFSESFRKQLLTDAYLVARGLNRLLSSPTKDL